MKVAIYQGFPFHFEMIGYVIDYCMTHGHTFTVFSPQSDWIECYERIFKQPVTFVDTHLLKPDSYDMIFLLTDDDRSFHEDWLKLHARKVICIDHHFQIRRHAAIHHVGTRFFPDSPRPWALPCYAVMCASQKKQVLKEQNGSLDKIVVTCIGESSVVSDVETYKRLLGLEFKNMELHLINRHARTKPCKEKNVFIHTQCPTPKMLAILERTTHVLFLPCAAKNYERQCISGTIPLAFNYVCQMILPHSWQEQYHFDSVMSYNPHHVLRLDMEDYLDNLNAIVLERDRLVDHRNIIFEDIAAKLQSP